MPFRIAPNLWKVLLSNTKADEIVASQPLLLFNIEVWEVVEVVLGRWAALPVALRSRSETIFW